MSSATGTPPTALTTVAAPVERRLAALLDQEIADWSAIDRDLTEPLESLRGFVLGGGKRLRPAFCHWAFVGAGGTPGDDAIVDAGAAFELLHAFARPVGVRSPSTPSSPPPMTTADGAGNRVGSARVSPSSSAISPRCSPIAS